MRKHVLFPALLALTGLGAPALAQAPVPGGSVTAADRAAIASCVNESGEMPRACIGTIAVVCTREPGAQREGGEVGCSRREAAVWRERLDLALNGFAQRLQPGPRNRLAALQRTWESYAAQKCAFAAEIQPPARAAPMQAGCELRETALRAMEIERMARRQARPGDARPQLHR
jgi:Lysozyme inhibitor LprI